MHESGRFAARTISFIPHFSQFLILCLYFTDSTDTDSQTEGQGRQKKKVTKKKPYAAIDPYKEGVGVHGFKGPKPPSSFKKVDDFQAVEVGLEDKFQLEAVRGYLFSNGKMSLKPVSLSQCSSNLARIHTFQIETVHFVTRIRTLQVPGDGDCMLHAIMSIFGFASADDKRKYLATHLRRQVVIFMAR